MSKWGNILLLIHLKTHTQREKFLLYPFLQIIYWSANSFKNETYFKTLHSKSIKFSNLGKSLPKRWKIMLLLNNNLHLYKIISLFYSHSVLNCLGFWKSPLCKHWTKVLKNITNKINRNKIFLTFQFHAWHFFILMYPKLSYGLL